MRTSRLPRPRPHKARVTNLRKKEIEDRVAIRARTLAASNVRAPAAVLTLSALFDASDLSDLSIMSALPFTLAVSPKKETAMSSDPAKQANIDVTAKPARSRQQEASMSDMLGVSYTSDKSAKTDISANGGSAEANKISGAAVTHRGRSD